MAEDGKTLSEQEVDHLLMILAEECIEMAKECMKAYRFGLDDLYEETRPVDRIVLELNDVLGILTMLQDAKVLPKPIMDVSMINQKIHKVKEMMEYSKKKGKL